MFKIYDKKQNRCTVSINLSGQRSIVHAASWSKVVRNTSWPKKKLEHPVPYFCCGSTTQINKTAKLKPLKAAFPSD